MVLPDRPLSLAPKTIRYMKKKKTTTTTESWSNYLVVMVVVVRGDVWVVRCFCGGRIRWGMWGKWWCSCGGGGGDETVGSALGEDG